MNAETPGESIDEQHVLLMELGGLVLFVQTAQARPWIGSARRWFDAHRLQ